MPLWMHVTLLAASLVAGAALNGAILFVVARLLRAKAMTPARSVLVFLVVIAFIAPLN